MSSQYPNAFSEKYEADVHIQFAQRSSRLRGKVMERSMVGGETLWLPQIGAVVSNKPAARHEDTQYNDTPHTTRKLTSDPRRAADLIDIADRRRSVADFMGPYASVQAQKLGRDVDDTILTAATGTNYYKVNGATSETSIALPATQQVAVNFGGSNEGLTLGKLIETKSILGKNETPMGEMLYFVHRQAQLDDLLNNVDQTVNSRYSDVKALVNGEINNFMGFEFIKTELVDVDSNDYASCIGYTKSALMLGISQDITGRVEQLPTKNYSWQIWSEVDVGATRIQEEGVVETICDESP